MSTVLVFAGTFEGRMLVEQLAKLSVRCMASVATDYGEAMLNPQLPVTLLKGRMDTPAMQQLIAAEGVRLVIDATHPYACMVSQNIKSACEIAGIEHWRLVRQPAADAQDGCCERYDHIADIIQRLRQLEGNILLTTGSKDLAAFTKLPGYRERVYPRVLPAVFSLEECLRLGYDPRKIICMQGPFSQSMNEAFIRELAIETMVTKESGRAGGFMEKLAAANACGIPLLVLGRPVQEQGLTLSECLARLRQRYPKEEQADG